MTTIVEYRESVPPVNDYPLLIVSPPRPSACCAEGMVRIGSDHIEHKPVFYYKRCRVCGFTVRLFRQPAFTPAADIAEKLRGRPRKVVEVEESEARGDAGVALLAAP